jgi:hypothetical protein
LGFRPFERREFVVAHVLPSNTSEKPRRSFSAVLVQTATTRVSSAPAARPFDLSIAAGKKGPTSLRRQRQDEVATIEADLAKTEAANERYRLAFNRGSSDR